jgi:predicted nucleic acid-binding Zn ribbon protein
MSFRSLSPLGSTLQGVLKSTELEARVKEHTCVLVWDEVVGEQLARSAQPEFIRDGIMFVATKSAVWSNELTFYKRDLISRLNSRVGGYVLKDMVFKVGRTARKKNPAQLAGDQKPVLAGIKLSNDELKHIEAVSSSVGEELRESFKKLMTTALKLEKWKISLGWTPCSKCGALQNTSAGICPVCVREKRE